MAARDKSEFDASIARTLTRPSVQAAATIYEYEQGAKQGRNINAFVGELSAQADAVIKGDLRRVEAMLVAQAHTLDEVFNNLARRAYRNMGEHLPAAETYLRLALKAQSQCRASLETLAQIKNPPIVYAKQANIANGPQQVNNGISPQAREIEKPQNKLLEAKHGERLDTGAAGAASNPDPQLAALGKIDRPQDRIRKNEGI
ncbi:MAG: hypothetical protein Q8L65_06975 [Burkholderiales bacterium]|nr:hypothetical protein [Burkholderiales bacterium]MDP2398969.1 hypothetical protein [Burkholderiales bacterium]